MPTPLPTRRALLAALPGAVAIFYPAGPVLAADAAPVPRDAHSALPPPNAEVRRTRQQLDTLNQLLLQTRQAEGIADQLLWALQRIADQWRDAEAARQGRGDNPALATLLATLRNQTLPGLANLQARWQAAVRQVDTSAEAHLVAVQAVLTASASRRAVAMARLDIAAATRRAAEAAERDAGKALRQAMQQAGWAASELSHRWRTLGDALAGTNDGLRKSATDWASLHAQWQALQAAAQAADQHSASLPALPQPTAPWVVPAAWTPPGPPDRQPLADWRSSQAQADVAQAARWLQADALSAARQALADATCHRPAADIRAACTAWRNDAAGLQSGLARQQAALELPRGQQSRAAAALWDQLAAAQPQLQAMLDGMDGLAPAATAAGGAALQALQGAIIDSEVTLRRLTQAQGQAQAAWLAAWRAQYGGDPPMLRPAAPAMAPAPAPVSRSSAASMASMLSSHALHRLRVRDDEPTGFGAYTYVLVGASVRPGTPGVFARLQRLLAAVHSLPIARSMPDALRAQANTFVVPVPPDNDDDSPLVVDLPLAQSLLTHLPPVLRLANVRRQLYIENGPFLITLPGRLADARADWPLLFADLSRTPEAVVADVVRRYMADLIGDFNPATTTWSPPAGMQVAITLVRLVKGSGDVAQAVFGGFGR